MRYRAFLHTVECISSSYIVPAAASYTRSDKPKFCCFHQIAFLRRFLDESEATGTGRLLLRDPVEALTLIRKRCRIKESYRINDIR
jgi:hypothetical protein